MHCEGVEGATADVRLFPLPVASADAKPLRNKKVQLVLTPKSNEIKRNQMKSNFLDEHPFPVLQYHCRNSGE